MDWLDKEEEFDLDGLNIEYGFCADERIREAVRAQVPSKMKAYDSKYRSLYVQKFEKSQDFDGSLEKACYHITKCPYAPTTIPPFEIEGDDDSLYVLTISKGRPFDPSKDKDRSSLYESAPVSDGDDQKMFISKFYISIIKDIFATVLYFIRFIPRVRCVIDLKALYIDGDLNDPVYDTDDNDEYKDWRLPNVRFMKYYLLDEGQKDDKAMICEQLKDIFDDINTKSCIGGAPKEEFKLFMDSFHKITNVCDVFNNVVFASKKARIELMGCFLRHFIGRAETCDDLASASFGPCDDLVSDAFGDDWVSKLEQHPSLKVLLPKYKLDSLRPLNVDRRKLDLLPPNKQNRRELDAINDIITCIQIIMRLYVSFGDKKRQTKEIENIDQLVEIVHCMFPNHIAVLTRRAYKEGLILPRFEPFVIRDCPDVYPYGDSYLDMFGYNYHRARRDNSYVGATAEAEMVLSNPDIYKIGILGNEAFPQDECLKC